MSKLYLINPLAVLGARAGYSRPLDRHDFPHGTIPDRAGMFVPGTGELRRFANLTNMMGDSGVGPDQYSYGTTQYHPLGTLATTKDGRLFRYSTAGASALVVGNLLQSAAPVPNHIGITAAAQAIGDGGPNAPIVFTPGNTAGAANLYAEGTLVVSVTPGLGQCLRVSGHAAISSGTVFNLYLDPDDRIQVALTTGSAYGLHHNPYKNVIQAPNTLTNRACGVAVSTIAANTTAQNYGWVQTRGIAAVLINGTPAVNAPVINSATTAGAVDVWTAAAQPTHSFIGHIYQVGVSTECNPVFLIID